VTTKNRKLTFEFELDFPYRVECDTLLEALVESLKKWKSIRSFIFSGRDHGCPLCELKEAKGNVTCDGCVLDDYGTICCKEWASVKRAIERLIARLEGEIRRCENK